MLTLVPSVTSLAVALAGHRVTAAISVSTVTCFSTVCPPVTRITTCNRHRTFDINGGKTPYLHRKNPQRYRWRRRRLRRCTVTFPAVVSSPARSAGAPPARPVAASVVLTDALHLTSLPETSARTCCGREKQMLGNVWDWCSSKSSTE